MRTPLPYGRTILKLLPPLLLLAAGAAVNVAVAWGCSILIVVPANPGHYSGPYRSWLGSLAWAKDDWRVLVWRQAGWVRVFSLIPDDPSSTVRADSYVVEMLVTSGFEVDEGGEKIPVWSRASPKSRVQKSPTDLVEDGFGWPSQSMKSQFEADTAGKIIPSASFEGIVIRELRGGRVAWPDDFDVPRALPLQPLWPGFAVNTLFYAAVLWVLFAIPGALRRMIRSFRGRRGQCAMCAYPIPGGGTNEKCTECGASVIPAAPRAGIQ